MQFHYVEILQKFGSSEKLEYTDTDSLFYHIQTHDVHKDLADNIDSYSVDNPVQSKENAKVLGKTKDEFSSLALQELFGTAS